MDNRQVPITVGQAFNIATQIVTSDPEFTPTEGTIGQIAVIASDLTDVILDAQREAETKYATSQVTAAFPGTQQVPAPAADPFPQQQNVVPFPQQAQQAPAPIPGAVPSKKDQAWQAYFANPSDYYDNRQNKRNPNAPDFKHKQTGEGLWLGGKFPAPEWVLARLGGA